MAKTKITINNHGYQLIKRALRKYSQIAEGFDQAEKENAEKTLEILNKLEVRTPWDYVEIIKKKDELS